MLPIFDAHADTLTRLWKTNQPLRGNDAHIDLNRNQYPHAQFFALWREPYHVLLDFYRQQCAAHADAVLPCTSVEDLHKAWSSNRLAAFLSIEGAELIACQVDRLDSVYHDGIRMIGLTWNHANALCGSCVENPEQGLTAQGRAFVRRCFELGILVDVAHVGAAAVEEVLDMADAAGRPIVCSHANSRAVCDHPRNLTDEQFQSIHALGGVVGLNLYTYFINGQATATWQDAARHVLHWLALGGEDALAVGGDWDGCDIDGTQHIVGCAKGVDEIGLLCDILTRSGVSRGVQEKLLYRNMIRVVESCVTSAHATKA